MPQFIVDGVACDWVGVGTWNENTMRLLAPAASGAPAKVRNYTGESVHSETMGGSVFWGTGVQFVRGEQRPHHFMQATGGLAQRFLLDAMELVTTADRLLKCTRIDLQVTVPLDKKTKFNGAQLWQWFPEKGQVNGEGKLVSLYPQGFGSATDRYWRIYVKVDDSERHWLRFEVMLRGKVAKQTFKGIQNTLIDIAAVWIGEQERLIEKWPILGEIDELGTAVTVAIAQSQGANWSAVVERTERNTYKWLLETAIPSARRFINSHDTPLAQREDVLAHLKRAVGECFQ